VPLILTVLAGLLLSRPAAADQVVYFVNGKAITVKKVEKGDRLTILEIDGGGRIGVPTAQIDRIEELQLSPQSPALVAPPVAMAPAQGAFAAPASNAGQPAVALQSGSQTMGPGFGGQPVQPNGGLAGATPLQVTEAPVREGAAASAAMTPGATSASSRPPMQPGGNRQMGARREGGISQPNVGLRRPGTRSGALRGRPMVGYQPPLAPSERRRQESADGSEPKSAAPSPPPTRDSEPADDPGLVPDDPEADQADQAAEAPTADEADSSDPPAEEEGDDPAEER
jgi:hypothetical protein